LGAEAAAALDEAAELLELAEEEEALEANQPQKELPGESVEEAVEFDAIENLLRLKIVSSSLLRSFLRGEDKVGAILRIFWDFLKQKFT